MTALSTTVLQAAAECFNYARKNIYEGAALLYKIQEEGIWEGQYSSFSEYVEQECQVSRSYASKLLQAWKFYVVEGGVSQRTLVGVDAEKLYLALKLPKGTVEQRLVKAREWSREDLRDELASQGGVDCDHPEESRVTLCGKCGKRLPH